VAEGAPPEGTFSEEDVRRLEEELRRLKVSDVLVQTLYTLSSLGFGRLMPEGRDLEQARLAIEAIGALVPVLEGSLPAQAISDFNQVKANLQLAYASAVAEGAPADSGEEAAVPEDVADDAAKDDSGGS
jgi:hypothetical protein